MKFFYLIAILAMLGCKKNDSPTDSNVSNVGLESQCAEWRLNTPAGGPTSASGSHAAWFTQEECATGLVCCQSPYTGYSRAAYCYDLSHVHYFAQDNWSYECSTPNGWRSMSRPNLEAWGHIDTSCCRGDGNLCPTGIVPQSDAWSIMCGKPQAPSYRSQEISNFYVYCSLAGRDCTRADFIEYMSQAWNGNSPSSISGGSSQLEITDIQSAIDAALTILAGTLNRSSVSQVPSASPGGPAPISGR